MKNFRKYGIEPFTIAVIHGGPGTPGEMAPVAKELSSVCGILEPLQTSASIDEQLQELQILLKNHAEVPVILIGHSWGAWLSFIFTARYPEFVKKLILIASGPFEEKYASGITQTRLSRLTEEERAIAYKLMDALSEPGVKDKNLVFAQLGKLLPRMDSFDPVPFEREILEYQYSIYQNVWKEASELRKSGNLLQHGKYIQCPVVAIHGDYDPHPAEGVERPLSQVVKDFRFIRLKNCGHAPWIERDTKDRFYEVLKDELS